MAGRILNRRELRKQADQADAEADVEVGTADAEAPEAPAKPAKKGAKAKAPAAAKPKKPRKKKAPVRMCARWAVYDTGMKQVALFDYNQRAMADDKAAELRAKKNGVYFVQILKEPMPEPAPTEAPVA